MNQDAPDTYHLFYADAEGHAGSDITFFPWPDLPRGRRGVGLTNEVALAVPTGTLGWWSERLRSAGTLQALEQRWLTAAASAPAQARPIPLAAPVTNAERPVRSYAKRGMTGPYGRI